MNINLIDNLRGDYKITNHIRIEGTIRDNKFVPKAKGETKLEKYTAVRTSPKVKRKKAVKQVKRLRQLLRKAGDRVE